CLGSSSGFISRGPAAPELRLIYATLTVHSLDQSFTTDGVLAHSMVQAEANTWVRFHLRPEARFHDGQPITASEVVFTFNALLEKGAPFYKAYYGDVKEEVAEDEHSVICHFTHARNRELPRALGQLPVLPEHYWSERDFSRTGL